MSKDGSPEGSSQGLGAAAAALWSQARVPVIDAHGQDRQREAREAAASEAIMLLCAEAFAAGALARMAKEFRELAAAPILDVLPAEVWGSGAALPLGPGLAAWIAQGALGWEDTSLPERLERDRRADLDKQAKEVQLSVAEIVDGDERRYQARVEPKRPPVCEGGAFEALPRPARAAADLACAAWGDRDGSLWRSAGAGKPLAAALFAAGDPGPEALAAAAAQCSLPFLESADAAARPPTEGWHAWHAKEALGVLSAMGCPREALDALAADLGPFMGRIPTVNGYGVLNGGSDALSWGLACGAALQGGRPWPLMAVVEAARAAGADPLGRAFPACVDGEPGSLVLHACRLGAIDCAMALLAAGADAGARAGRDGSALPMLNPQMAVARWLFKAAMAPSAGPPPERWSALLEALDAAIERQGGAALAASCARQAREWGRARVARLEEEAGQRGSGAWYGERAGAAKDLLGAWEARLARVEIGAAALAAGTGRRRVLKV